MPTWLDYMGIANQQRYAAQDQQMKMQMFQQAQQDRQRQQAAMQAAGNALPQLLPSGQVSAQPQMPPPPQAPMPGQPSQPMMQPGQMPPQQPQNGGGVPLPQGQPGQQPPPLPPGGPQGQMPQGGLPPFRPMPTTPPPQAQQAAPSIAPPPQPAPQAQQGSGPLSLESAVKVLQDQGLSGADLMAGLQQLTPLLDSQAKQQANMMQAKFSQEMKLANLSTARDSLQARIDASKQASEDRRLGIQERMQAHEDQIGLQRQLMQFRIEEAKAKHAGDPDAKLDKDTVDILAQQALAGDTSVYQNLGRGVQGAQNIVAIRKRVAELAKDQGKGGADIAAGNVAYGGEKAAARSTAVSSGKQAQAADEANQLADQALEINNQFQRGNYPDINKALTDLQRRGGDTQVGQFKVAINGFKNTYSRAISPTGTPTVHDKQHADELFDLNQSPAQFAANIAQAKKEMQAAIQAPGHVQAQQRARIAGGGNAASSAAPAIPQGWTVTEH